jgi:hypothetical protein
MKKLGIALIAVAATGCGGLTKHHSSGDGTHQAVAVHDSSQGTNTKAKEVRFHIGEHCRLKMQPAYETEGFRCTGGRLTKL